MITMRKREIPSRTRRALLVLASFASLVMSGLIHAQTPGRVPASRAATANRLPVKRVVLYKSGVGYFEHVGRVRGNQIVTVDFTSGQLDDALSSLTTLDLDGGRISGISYNSEAALDRRLGALRLPLGEQATRAQFFSALRGAKLEVVSGAVRVTGRLLSVERVERVERRSDGATTSVDALTLVSAAGEMRTVALDPGVSVRVVEADLNQEVGTYLSLVASARDQDLRQLTIATTGAGDRDLFVSYVSEVPIWKATYRLVLPGAGEPAKPLLQGWAIVDNTVGEDWQNVQLSLVAGAPQSFIQQVSRPYYVQRPVVPLPQRVTLSPQTHQAALGASGNGELAGTVTDAAGVVPGATVRVMKPDGSTTVTTTDSAGRYRISNVAPGAYDLNFSMPGFRTESRSSVAVSGGMETVLNVTMGVGSRYEGVTMPPSPSAAPGAAPRPVTGNMTLDGVPGGTRVGGATSGLAAVGGGRGGGVYQPASGLAVDAARLAQQVDADAGQLGDLFEYKLKEPVTIRKNQSALVPILSGEVDAQKVSLWNASAGSVHPLSAIWLTNTTGLTLDGGNFSVIEGQAFAGEGLTDPLKAGERRLLSYAVDLGLSVEVKGDNVPTRVWRVQVSRGLVIQSTEERQRRTYTVRNEDDAARVVVIEHPARAGWTLSGSLTPAESTAAWHRLRVPVGPKTTVTFTVEEVRPVQTQFAVNAITDQQVALLVQDQAVSAPIEAALRQVITRKAEVARLTAEAAAREAQIAQISQDQERVRENMKSLQGTREERQLLQRYVKQLNEQENRLDELRGELKSVTTQRQAAEAELGRFIEAMST